MSSRARANFECKHCQKIKGDPDLKITNLPLDSKRCPMCGHARGFKRLFDAINVSSRHSNHKRRYIDRQLEPAFQEHGERKDAAKRFEQAGKEAMDRAWDATPGAKREEIAAKHPDAIQAMKNGTVGQPIAAGAALGAVPREARRDSQQYTYPAAVGRSAPLTGNPQWDAAQGTTNRRVVPAWVRGGKK
jgi:hypothetical protein